MENEFISAADVVDISAAIQQMSQELNEKKEQVFQSLLTDLLGREPVKEDYKRLTLARHPQRLGEPLVESVFWEAYSNRFLLGTVSIEWQEKDIAVVFRPHLPKIEVDRDVETTFTISAAEEFYPGEWKPLGRIKDSGRPEGVKYRLGPHYDLTKDSIKR